MGDHPLEDDKFFTDEEGNLSNNVEIDVTFGGKYQCEYLDQQGLKVIRQHSVYVKGINQIEEGHVWILFSAIGAVILLLMTICIMICIFCRKRKSRSGSKNITNNSQSENQKLVTDQGQNNNSRSFHSANTLPHNRSAIQPGMIIGPETATYGQTLPAEYLHNRHAGFHDKNGSANQLIPATDFNLQKEKHELFYGNPPEMVNQMQNSSTNSSENSNQNKIQFTNQKNQQQIIGRDRHQDGSIHNSSTLENEYHASPHGLSILPRVPESNSNLPSYDQPKPINDNHEIASSSSLQKPSLNSNSSLKMSGFDLSDEEYTQKIKQSCNQNADYYFNSNQELSGKPLDIATTKPTNQNHILGSSPNPRSKNSSSTNHTNNTNPVLFNNSNQTQTTQLSNNNLPVSATSPLGQAIRLGDNEIKYSYSGPNVLPVKNQIDNLKNSLGSTGQRKFKVPTKVSAISTV